MFLKEALKMTDMINKFNAAGEQLQNRTNAAGYRKGIAAVNLAAAFQARGVVFGPMDFTGDQNEK